MKRELIWGLLALSSLSVQAEEFDAKQNPQVLEKNYQAMDYINVPYEIGKSTITLSTDCQTSREQAQSALELKEKALMEQIVAKADELGLGEENEKWGMDLAQDVFFRTESPVSNTFSAQDNKFFFTNRCTDEKSEKPLREKEVVVATKVITFWFPNQGTVLNDLTNLVTTLENLSDAAVQGVKVDCNSNSGGNYDLAVTPKTEAEVWAKVEASAKKRAIEKAKLDYETTQYDQFWKVPGGESFSAGSQTNLPFPTVVKEDGQWVAQFNTRKDFSVFYKQSSDTSTKKGKLLDQKIYQVEAQAESEEGLYGTIDVRIEKLCVDSKKDAEAEVAKVGESILEDHLRALNGNSSSETDSLKVLDASAQSYNPLVPYDQMVGTKKVRFYYDPCTLQTFEVTQKPEVLVWKATQSLSIRSSNLDALVDLKKELEEKYASSDLDPSVVKVTINQLPFTAKLSIRDKFGSVLESKAVEKFLADSGPFKCEASHFSFACLAKPLQPPFYEGGIEFPGSAAMAKESAYTDSAATPVDASERGMATFQGVYTIKYYVRKVLIDHEG